MSVHPCCITWHMFFCGAALTELSKKAFKNANQTVLCVLNNIFFQCEDFPGADCVVTPRRIAADRYKTEALIFCLYDSESLPLSAIGML